MSELIIKQRLLSLLDSFNVTDEKGKVKYKVKGKMSMSRHKLVVYDAKGRELATLKEKIVKLMPTFNVIVGGKTIGRIKKEVTVFRPKYYVDFRNWNVTGNIVEWDYTIKEGNKVVAVTRKKLFRLTDTYSITVNDPADELDALLVILAIDAARCAKGKDGEDI